MEEIKLNQEVVQDCCRRILDRMLGKHIRPILDSDGPVVYISDTYPGVWMEHIFDGQVWARLTGETQVAQNYVRLFLKHQRPDGQLPCFIWKDNTVGYCQLQECVSFGQLAYEAWELAPDEGFLRAIYDGTAGWVRWLRENRMKAGHGLVEMYCGYDTGHDESGRLDGMKYPRNLGLEASEYPADCEVAPLLAPDVNACFYGNHLALAKMAKALGRTQEAAHWQAQAEEIRALMFKLLWNEEDQFFYDVDKHGNQRKCRNISITNVFTEKVLDRDQVTAIFDRYFRNPGEFGTPYPYPSMSAGAPVFEKRKAGNSWGYYCQGLTMLRTLRWMKGYGLERELHENMRKWIAAWTDADLPFGQELDPFTGEPSACSPWYSATMLFYLASARELGIFNDFI